MKTICIDAGHGGKDPGACAGGVREKDIALYTVFKIGTLLADYELIYTRFTDVYVSLSKRARIANAAEVDLFVSIHCNSAPNSSANGMEVYVHTSRGADSTRAAHAIYDRLLPASGLRGRGIKSKDLAVLRETDMPAVLVELAFISNDNDRAKLVSDEWQERAAEAIAAGIMEVIGKP
ncbi:N-acetylmuramoyl-L-alanine amidase [uncultured Cloacibacillus sp.]|uniref:N-acetylmuramoyl-L-alanine amidase family protein n=1 Tax=uncultured Cloacibacillus sp. TaxID=889794 RepID=UPI0032093FF0